MEKLNGGKAGLGYVLRHRASSSRVNREESRERRAERGDGIQETTHRIPYNTEDRGRMGSVYRGATVCVVCVTCSAVCVVRK